MTSPRNQQPDPSMPASSSTLLGGDWLKARASLAFRRSRRFVQAWSAVFGLLAVGALGLPLATGDPRAPERRQLERGAADTLLSSQQLRRAEAAVTRAESLLSVARSPSPSATRSSVGVPARAAEVADPALEAFARAIGEARRLRTVGAWLAVAEQSQVSAGPRMRSLADSLRSLAAQREALPSGPQRQLQMAALSQQISRVGYTILVIAENRRSDLAVSTSSTVAPSLPTTRSDVLESGARADSVPLKVLLATARDTLARTHRRHDSLKVSLSALDSALSARERSSFATAVPALAAVVFLVLGVAVRFGVSLRAEIKMPTLAHAHEAEQVSGAQVLATVRDALLDGPARFRPSGVDPFRLIYLGLTATGTRARTAIITGSDPVIAAAAGARLAIAAAADHRATLIVDLDPKQIALARVFRERAEPGLTDALAGAFKWREVARAVGSSDGLPITLLPAGTERDDLAGGEALAAARDEFTKFRAHFELTIIVAPPERLDLAAAITEPSPLILTATAGETTVLSFGAESEAVRSSGRRIQGVVLWDAPKPEIPTRAGLAALVSKRKGRTPGGSFEAVRKAIRDKYS